MLYNWIMYGIEIGIAMAGLFNDKIKKMWKGEQSTFDKLSLNIDPKASYLWFHAASLGEFEQGRPLIETIKEKNPDYKILLTFFSPSGYEVRKDYDGADIVAYLPIDTPKNAKRFVELVRPKMAFFIKYEFWYNYLEQLYQHKIPVYSVSSIFRHNQIFFRWYGQKYAKVLRFITHFFVQNEESEKLLNTLKIDKVSVVGDTRFDRVVKIKADRKSLPLIEQFVEGEAEDRKRPVFVMGSTWGQDEEVLIPYLNKHNFWKIIIAPHVVSDNNVEKIMASFSHKKVVRYSSTNATELASADVMIIDGYGFLSSVYGYADIAYVGGGFGVGIHNVLEAAVWGVPVIFGPNNKRFAEAKGLINIGGGIEVESKEAFESLMKKLEAEPQAISAMGEKAAKYVAQLSGATQKIINYLDL